MHSIGVRIIEVVFCAPASVIKHDKPERAEMSHGALSETEYCERFARNKAVLCAGQSWKDYVK